MLPRFIAMFQSLTAKEKAEFARFVNGLEAESSQPAVLLNGLEPLLKKHSKNSLPSEGQLPDYEVMFPGASVKNPDKQLSNLYSILARHLEDFLLLRHLQEQLPFERQLLLLHYWRQQTNQQQAERTHTNLKSICDKKAPDHSTLLGPYLSDYFLETNRYFSASETQWKLTPPSGTALDHFFLLHKLRIHLECSWRRLITNEPYEADELTVFILKFLADPTHQPDPLIRIYMAFAIVLHHWTSEADTSSLPDAVDQLGKELLRYLPEIPDPYRKELTGYLHNLLSLSIRTNQPDTLERALVLLQNCLSYRSKEEKTEMQSLMFLNIVDIMLKANKLKEAKIFIKDWLQEVPDSEKEAVRALTQAMLYFASKNFEKAYQYILTCELPDHSFSIRARALKLCILYELRTEYRNELQLALDSANKFVQDHAGKKQLGQTLLTAFENFALCIRELFYERDTPRVADLISGTAPLLHRICLREKLSAYRPGNII